jgi:tripartite-type tricarboxylate transporter receptor subunit TctC
MYSKLDRRRLLALFLSLLGGSLAIQSAHAQTYPDRPVKLTVGFAPGTGPDVLTRTIGIKLGENLHTPIVIDNRAGAGGQIAAQVVAKSPPDGYTLLIADVSAISIAPAAFSKLGYNPATELIVLVVPSNSPAQNVREFVSAAAANPGKVNFGTFGAGTPGHFGAEVLAELGNFKVEPIHYRATGDAVSAVVSGDVQAVLMSTPLAAAQIKGGKMRALATTAPKRSSLLPNVPTFIESGMPKADFTAWFCLFAPAGTPAPVVATLNAQVNAAIQAQDTKQRLEEAGFSVFGTSSADAQKMIAAETPRWARIVKATGFRGD